MRDIAPWGRVPTPSSSNVTEPQCRKAGLDTNDRCLVTPSSKL
jgi:hypothetical protein